MISLINSPSTRISSFSISPGWVNFTAYLSILGTFNSCNSNPPLALGLAPIGLYGTNFFKYGNKCPLSSNSSSG